MKKRVFSLFITFCLILGLVPTTAYAADQTSSNAGIRIQYVENSYDEETGVFQVNVQAKLPSGVGISSMGVMLSFDNTKLTLINQNNGNELGGSEGTLQSPKAAAIRVLLTDEDEYGSESSYSLANGDLYKSGDRSALYAYFYTTDATTGKMNTGDWFDCFQVKFKMSSELDSDSLRIADADKDNAVISGAFPANDIYSVYITDNSNPANIYCFNKMAGNTSGDASDGKYVMAAEGTGTATYPGSTNQPDQGEDNDPETDTGYQVYYVIDGTDSDSDNYVEIAPGATFDVGVYVKSTDDSTKNMQAFDIYPTWDSMLSLVTENDAVKVVAADAGEIVVDEMSKTTPHFYSVAKDLNKEVDANGVKIATMTMQLSDNAVYNTGYKVGLSDQTNMAVALNAESVPVTVDTTEKGAETLKKVKVTFNTDDEGFADAEQEIGYNTTATRPANNPSKNGYTFDNWYADADLNTVFDFSTALKADTTIYAKWNAADVSVTLDANGGKFANDVTAKTVTETYASEYTKTLAETAPTREGYTFAGWYDAQTDGNKIDSSYKVTNHAAHTLYAQWTPNEYTIKFDGNEADNGSVTEVKVKYNEEFTMPENGFTREGWQFNGWNTMADGKGTSYTAGTKYTGLISEGEMTLYAQWTKANYNVVVAEDITGGKVELNKQAADYEEAVQVTVTPDEGYEIGSVFYYLTADADDENKTTYPINVDSEGKYIFNMPAGNVTVSATFNAIDYTVEVDTGIEHGTVNIQSGETGVDRLENAHVKDIITLNVTPSDGYQVKSVTYTYTKNGDNQVTVGTATKGENGKYTFEMPAADVTVTAEFEAETYTVTLNANQGAFEDNENTKTVTVTYGGDYSALYDADNTPTRTGYTFAGWYTAEEGGTEVEKNATVNSDPTTTLYAHWDAKQYTITFVTNGGSFATNSGVAEQDGNYTMTYTYGAEASLPEITKNLHSFVNWTVSYPDTNTTEHGWGEPNGETPVTIGDKADIRTYFGDVTLTANWTAGFTYEIEDYKYAPADYVMLRIATEKNTNSYVFNNGETDIVMYFTDDTNYKLDGKAVYVTLIPSEGNVETVNSKVVLTTTGLDKLSHTNEEAVEITRDGKVNNDDVVNIADANAVYQMVIGTGSYYSLDQLEILNRLKADMDTAPTTGETNNEYRGSLLDVHEIVDIINENANPTTP